MVEIIILTIFGIWVGGLLTMLCISIFPFISIIGSVLAGMGCYELGLGVGTSTLIGMVIFVLFCMLFNYSGKLKSFLVEL